MRLNGNQSRSSLRSYSYESTRLSGATSTASSSICYVRNVEDWINIKSLRRIQKHHSAENYDTRQMYLTVLSNEENFVKGIDKFLNDQELLNLRRKELLYRQWHEKIYEPTRTKIEETFKEGYPRLDLEKRKAYEKYLSYESKKGEVFLNTTSPDEYDALTLFKPENQALLKAATPVLQDPLLLQERRKIDELKVVLQCETGGKKFNKKPILTCPLPPLNHRCIDSTTWLEMSLKQIESPARSRSRKRMKGILSNSTHEFGKWSHDEDNAEIVKKELRIQTRKRFDCISALPNNETQIRVVPPARNKEVQQTVSIV